MKAQLFLDSIKMSISNFQAQAFKLLTNSKPLSHKLQDMSLSLLSLKTSLLKSLSTFLKQPQQGPLQQLQAQYEESSKKIKKLQLHALLKKKIRRIQKETMMQSIASNALNASQSVMNGSFMEDPAVAKLRNSVMLIERDLGIEGAQEEEAGGQGYGYGYGYGDVSGVVHRSMVSLEMTPIRTDRSEVSDNSIRLDDSCVMPENFSLNGPQIQVQKPQQSEKGKQRQKAKQKQKEKERITQVRTSSSKPAQKKKKTQAIASTKQNMFGNLLEQSLETCFSASQKP